MNDGLIVPNVENPLLHDVGLNGMLQLHTGMQSPPILSGHIPSNLF